MPICTRRLCHRDWNLIQPFRVGEEADALCLHAWFGLASDEGVDADDLALEIRQRAAGVAELIGASVWIASNRVGPWA
jgi:hypothetical protein